MIISSTRYDRSLRYSQPPKIPTDLASELSAYEKEEPTEAASPSSAGAADTYDALLELEEPDAPAAAHH